MNEEQLAQALSTHIDALLAGRPLSIEDAPEELQSLLSLAGQLAAIDLPPDPAFSARLQQSLRQQLPKGPSGPAGGGNIPPVVILGIVALIGLVGALGVTVLLSATLVLTGPTPQPPQTPTLASPVASPTATPATSTHTPSPSATPAITDTPMVIDTVLPAPASAEDRLTPKTAPPAGVTPALLDRPPGATPPSADSEDNESHPHDDHHHDDED